MGPSRKMRIFGSCLMIAVAAENLGDRPVCRCFGLMERDPQAKAKACAAN
ncbi:MAG: hypothetical protein K2H95_08660 [Bacteroidales bacterium]|nr:hypothetical protein [Bacteroidales bacterium]MDE5955609.1 hypothetical protein [Bacteroidales bacterium]MDE6146585.1 hypothetical protein [Bacteroidales bacterium]